MERLIIKRANARPASGDQAMALTGVVASGNLEVLIERVLPEHECEVDIHTPIVGFDKVWEAVVSDFVDDHAVGGLRLSINDGGARPDTVALRLAQALRLMQAPPPPVTGEPS